MAVRPAIDSIARRYGASAKVAEIPPGPPVLSTLVAEVYAADDSTRLEAARQVKARLRDHAGRGGRGLDGGGAAAARAPSAWIASARPRPGASVEQITQTLYLALSGAPAGLASSTTAREGVGDRAAAAARRRSSVDALLALPIATATGPQPLARS